MKIKFRLRHKLLELKFASLGQLPESFKRSGSSNSNKLCHALNVLIALILASLNTNAQKKNLQIVNKDTVRQLSEVVITGFTYARKCPKITHKHCFDG